ncbi:MAG: hypothetical protein K6G15_09735 [Desulfovibrio sp.]|nr:hypothetical protein [Desulfovibrio sp.]
MRQEKDEKKAKEAAATIAPLRGKRVLLETALVAAFFYAQSLRSFDLARSLAA